MHRDGQAMSKGQRDGCGRIAAPGVAWELEAQRPARRETRA